MEIVIWQKALTLMRDFLETTRQLEQKLTEDDADLAAFLGRRAEIITKMDRLKVTGGISSWAAVDEAEPGIKEISAEITRIINELIERDKQIRQEIEIRRDKIQGELAVLRAKKKASRSYQGGGISSDGVFIDSRR